MISLQAVGEFFLTEWLWSVTWGSYHPFFAGLCMFFLIKFFIGLKSFPSLCISLGATFFSFIIFTLFVAGLLIGMLKFEYITAQSEIPIHQPLIWAGIYLGLIYTALQTLLFLCVNRWYGLNLFNAVIVSLISNMFAAYIVNLLVPTMV